MAEKTEQKKPEGNIPPEATVKPLLVLAPLMQEGALEKAIKAEGSVFRGFLTEIMATKGVSVEQAVLAYQEWRLDMRTEFIAAKDFELAKMRADDRQAKASGPASPKAVDKIKEIMKYPELKTDAEAFLRKIGKGPENISFDESMQFLDQFMPLKKAIDAGEGGFERADRRSRPSPKDEDTHAEEREGDPNRHG